MRALLVGAFIQAAEGEIDLPQKVSPILGETCLDEFFGDTGGLLFVVELAVTILYLGKSTMIHHFPRDARALLQQLRAKPIDLLLFHGM